LEWTIRRTRYRFTVLNPEHRCQGVGSAEFDGVEVDADAIPLDLDGGVHDVTITLASRRTGALKVAAQQTRTRTS
jgi:hypothetical protein